MPRFFIGLASACGNQDRAYCSVASFCYVRPQNQYLEVKREFHADSIPRHAADDSMRSAKIRMNSL
jgi:hypothetical protein